jgi:hypothetical protein
MLVSQEAAAGAGLPADRLERRSLEIKGRSEPVDACVLRLVA